MGLGLAQVYNQREGNGGNNCMGHIVVGRLQAMFCWPSISWGWWTFIADLKGILCLQFVYRTLALPRTP